VSKRFRRLATPLRLSTVELTEDEINYVLRRQWIFPHVRQVSATVSPAYPLATSVYLAAMMSLFTRATSATIMLPDDIEYDERGNGLPFLLQSCVTETFRGLRNLKELVLAGPFIMQDAAFKFSDLPRLRTLSIDPGCPDFARLFAGSAHIRHLSIFSEGDFVLDEAQAAALPWTTLTSISLSITSSAPTRALKAALFPDDVRSRLASSPP
jgi:hypothetical protein